MGDRRNIGGIEGLYYIWNGEWADPQYEYKGLVCSEDDFWDYISDGEDVPDDAQLDPDELIGYLREYGKITPELQYQMIVGAIMTYAAQHSSLTKSAIKDLQEELVSAIDSGDIYRDDFEESAKAYVSHVCNDILLPNYEDYDEQEAMDTIEKLLDDIKTNPSKFWQPAWNFLYSL